MLFTLLKFILRQGSFSYLQNEALFKLLKYKEYRIIIKINIKFRVIKEFCHLVNLDEEMFIKLATPFPNVSSFQPESDKEYLK